MHPHIKQQWLDALRSGEYEQGKGMLRSADNKFCCWGVLQDLFGKENAVSWKLVEVDTGNYYEMHNNDGMPTFGCKTWAGVENTRIHVYLGEHFTTLDAHNDRGATFKEIADVIEENF